ncbi:hypothetical protein RB595_008486 [Gaeumannomyces hyphopodioides]
MPPFCPPSPTRVDTNDTVGGAAMSPEQQIDQGGRAMLPTESLAWNCLEAVRSRLSSRLADFTRVRIAQKRDNDAAFFEVDLRYVFKITPVVARLSPADYTDMDSKATELLESLDTLVNGQFIDTEDEQEPEGWEPESSGDVPVPHDAEMLRDKYRRLYALIIFLEGAEGNLNLATGPGSPIFTLPAGAVWSSALHRVAEWKALLERLAADSRSSYGAQLLPMRQPQMSAERTETQPGVLEKRASVVVGAMLKEFRRLNCFNDERTHEIKLRVPGDLYKAPLRPVLDIFVSCCGYGDDEEMQWQEAECGTFEVALDVERRDMCSAIERAKRKRRKLHLFVNQELGLLDVSDKIPPVQSATCGLEVKSLSDLLRDKFFQVKVKDLLHGTADGKFGSHKKAVLALSLAQCLMDFIDEELELASYSWNPKHIFFLYPKGTTASNGTLCISLRPKMARQQTLVAPTANLIDFICPGNPVLLSFARLLLEIHDGDELSLDIGQDNTKPSLAAWAQMCSALAKAESTGHFFNAVHGCLYLHLYLPKGGKPSAFPAAAGVLRRVLYENIVRYLELMVDPDSAKRKRDVDDMADLPDPKKVPVSPPPSDTGSEALSALSSGTTDPKAASDTQLVLRRKEDDKCSLLSVPPVGRRIKNPRRKIERPLSEKQALTSTTVIQRKAIPTPNTVTLYDDEKTGENSEDSKMAAIYFSHLDDVKKNFILPLVSHPTAATGDERLRRPVRIAVLDSGVDMSDPYVKGAAKRIKAKRNWTDDDPENWTDTYGHGTHVARLLIRVAPAAEIYVARVSTAKEIRPEKTGLIAKAINWAATEWNVDIISLSLGLDEYHPEIDKQLKRVLSPGTNGPKRIVIAAAANWAGNKDTAYPARRERVICIHATDGGGNPSKKNPTPRKGDDNFALLGLSIESSKREKENDSPKPAAGRGGGGALAGIGTAAAAAAGLVKPKPKRERVWISGTSYATPIAAGIAANVLEFARHHAEMTPGEREGLYSWFGMSRIFQAMSDVRSDYDYITPWKMFDPKHDTQTIVKCIMKILNGEKPREVMSSKK